MSWKINDLGPWALMPMAAGMLAFVTIASGCGVKQFNAKLPSTAEITPEIKTPSSRLVKGYGPHWAAGQGSGNMQTASVLCGNPPGSRPCVRARASVAVPFQYDVNPNTAVGPVAAGGTTYVPGVYAGPAGGTGGQFAGRTKAGAPGGVIQNTRIENRDLSIIKRQTAGGEQVF